MDYEQKNKGPRACTTCAKAKARCISGPKGSNKCERCHRLRKACGSQTPAPPRPKRDPRPTKVSELEKRLNELTTQLSATQGSASGTSPLATSAVVNGTVVGSADSSLPPPSNSVKPASAKIPINFDHLFPPRDALADDDAGAGASVPLQTPPGSSTADDHRTVSSRGRSQSDAPSESPWPLNNEQSILLQTFVDDLQPLYPFVIVPPNMGPAQLATERPYLWKGIQMTASHLNAAKQVRLGNELLQDIAQAAFTKPVRSLDVLQGLQLLIAWYHYNINSYQLTNLLFLARSMCISLGFKDNPIKFKGRGKGGCSISVQNQDDDDYSKARPQAREQASARLELMRAFAGCYYLNTLVFTTNKRPDAFMNTAHLESCCRQIEEAAEYPSDELLVQLFKIQQLAQTISLTLGAESTSFQSLQLPLTMVVQSFQQQLDIFKTSLPAHLKDNLGLLTHVSIAEVLLYEIGIPESQGPASFISQTERLELLWGCCSAAKTFLDLRFPRNNPSLQPRFTCLSSSDFLYVFILCLKLMTLEVPGWDLPLIQKHLDLAGVVDRQVAHLDLFVTHRNRQPAAGTDPTAPSTDVVGPNVVDPFFRLTSMLRYFKELVQGELSGSPSQPVIQGLAQQAPTNLSDGTQSMIRDLDVTFWSAMPDDDLGMWDVGSMFPAMDWTAT